MKANQIELKQIISTAIIFGLFGGCLLVYTIFLPIKGWWSILTYAIVMVTALLKLKANKKIEINYLKLFMTGVLTFIIMSYVLYFYISIFENPISGINLWGHTWRFLAILGFALASSAILALFFRRKNTE